MSRERDFWHKRYNQQVRWTLETRRYIFECINAHPAKRILEIGCGSGAVLSSLIQDGHQNVLGVDKDLQTLQLVRMAPKVCADAFDLPFLNGSFDISLCHFLLLWLADPLGAVKEMKRATKFGGWVLALAEPDYGGRIDYPPDLEMLGKAQSQALLEQCADVAVGRKLLGLFTECGLENIHAGIINAEWCQELNQPDFDLEWAVLRKDLKWKFSSEELDRFYSIDFEAAQKGQRVLFVPIFYAFGQVAG